MSITRKEAAQQNRNLIEHVCCQDFVELNAFINIVLRQVMNCTVAKTFKTLT